MSRVGSRRRGALIGAAVLAAVAGGVLGGLGGVAGLVGAPDRASAHDFLESTNPAADAVVTDALDTVSLTFNSAPLADGAAAIAIEVRDPSGANIATGPVAIVDATLSVPVAPTAVGVHQVLWQTVSSDGHPVSGQYTFDYEGPLAVPTPDATLAPTGTATVTAAPTATATPASTGTAAADTGTAAADTGAASGSSGGGVTPLVWVGIVSAAGVLAVVLVAALLVARRRPAATPEAPPAEPRAPESEREGD
ncbi:MAG: copper resistance protein CopC [Herbiconiux sp.]|uniref:copper resistance CopC family protein n=1 Tax=Herbiconiux sp. TaxID=1871186 RepID=UPI00122B0B3A|nr:copper resistance CopC family protein [Herbiconiux sp.]TAJ48411.1 MAG: copper resistance protein CopC [Herbiconiux sp.]